MSGNTNENEKDWVVFDVDRKSIPTLFKEAAELSTEAEASLSNYFLYIASLGNRRSSRQKPA
jgi:hypothetical protein